MCLYSLHHQEVVHRISLIVSLFFPFLGVVTPNEVVMIRNSSGHVAVFTRAKIFLCKNEQL